MLITLPVAGTETRAGEEPLSETRVLQAAGYLVTPNGGISALFRYQLPDDGGPVRRARPGAH
jgi:hypothetical protein